MTFLIGQRILRPGYTTLQSIIRDALSAEPQRLEKLVEEALDATVRGVLQRLWRMRTRSPTIKQDAKNFGHRMMVVERQKRATLAPLYVMAKALLPSLDISHLNTAYYASLANFYTVYDLRRRKSGQCKTKRSFVDAIIVARNSLVRELRPEISTICFHNSGPETR